MDSTGLRIGIFSDCHLHSFPDYAVPLGGGINSRAKAVLDVLDRISAMAVKRDWEALLFCGDFFETREIVRTPLVVGGVRWVEETATRIPVVMIHGNHDMATGEKEGPTSLDIFSVVPNVHVLRRGSVYQGNGFWVCGFGAEEFDPSTSVDEGEGLGILLLHDILRGSLSDNGFRFEEGVSVHDVEAFMENHNLRMCFMGDIHLRQRVKSHKFIKYVGNCIQKRAGENQEKGVHELVVEKRKVKFISIPSPCFLKYGDETVPDEIGDYHYVSLVVSDKDLYRELSRKYKSAVNVKVKFESRDVKTKRKKAHASVSLAPGEAVRSYVVRRMNDKKTVKRLVARGRLLLEES